MNSSIKASLLIIPILLSILSGCGENKTSTEEFITVDVTKSYSSKKKLILQDFMDVEYIALETNDEFINQGFVQAIGKDVILVTNYIDDGDIFVYDRTGKAIRKINRKGQGGEEYTYCSSITLDEKNNEIFINDHMARKIQVYDLEGHFKRSLKQKEGGGTRFYWDIFNYDKDNLICYDELNEEIPFLLVSKQDGSITKEIKTPFEEKKIFIQLLRSENGTKSMGPGNYSRITPFNDKWVLLEQSSDTIYTLMPDYSLHPLIMRTPPIHSMTPETMLILRLFSDRYIFMEAVKNEYDWEQGIGFPKTYFVYDTQEKEFSGYTVYNGDFSSKKEIYMVALTPINQESESWQCLDAHELVEAYKKGELKGKLKEIAATLNEDSNPVIMLIKHKNEITHE